MRLLYYYGEIVRFDKTMTDYVAINYSREYEFEHRMDKFFNRSNEILAVNVSFSERFLLSDFWSRNEKVYNCTVLVGENGTGKSTKILNPKLVSKDSFNLEPLSKLTYDISEQARSMHDYTI